MFSLLVSLQNDKQNSTWGWFLSVQINIYPRRAWINVTPHCECDRDLGPSPPSLARAPTPTPTLTELGDTRSRNKVELSNNCVN